MSDKNEASDKIIIDNESDIIQPYSSEDTQHFVFPDSPIQPSLCTKCDQCQQNISRYYFRQILPQISARSLQQNLLTSKNFKREDSELMNMWSAGFTIINIYVGLGLLSYPYALYQGGFISFIILAIICAFMSWTGKLLVRCFIRMRPSKNTYTCIGYKSFGKYGLHLISFGIIFEYLGVICIHLIFTWENCKYFIHSINGIPNTDTFVTAIICIVLILPTCWVLNFSKISFISFIGCICTILIIFSIFVYFVLNFEYVQQNVVNDNLSIFPKNNKSLSIGIGIFIWSFTGHPALPAVYNAMKEPERFESLMDRCFICLFIIYSTVGLLGYLQFAENTNIIITQNFINSGNDGQVLKTFVAQILITFIIFGLYFQISPLLSLLCEIPEMIIFKINTMWKRRIFRTVIFIFCAFISYVMSNHLAVLEAATGSICTMITSVVCPSLFYFAIYRNYTSYNWRCLLIFSALLGVLVAIFLLFNNISALF